MYLGFSRPCLVSVREKDSGGGLGDVGEIMRADELLKDSAEVVNVSRVDVEGGGMRDVVEMTIGEEKEGREGGVNVWGCGFGGSWGSVGVDSRPWVVGTSCCRGLAGVAVCSGGVEIPCWGSE